MFFFFFKNLLCLLNSKNMPITNGKFWALKWIIEVWSAQKIKNCKDFYIIIRRLIVTLVGMNAPKIKIKKKDGMVKIFFNLKISVTIIFKKNN